jgi:hypothetical protein
MGFHRDKVCGMDCRWSERQSRQENECHPAHGCLSGEGETILSAHQSKHEDETGPRVSYSRPLPPLISPARSGTKGRASTWAREIVEGKHRLGTIEGADISAYSGPIGPL